MKTICVANRKGGTGKTTVAFNLACTMAGSNNNVLMMDLDSQANLTLLCNRQAIPLDVWKGFSTTGVAANLSLLAASKMFPTLETEIQGRFDRNTYLRECLAAWIPDESSGKALDYLIIDTAPSLSILNINAFAVSDTVVIVVNPDAFSLAGLSEMDAILEQVRTIKPSRTVLALNAAFRGRVFTDVARERLAQHSGWVGVEIPHRQHVTNSNATKRPVIDDPEIAFQFRVLAEASK